MGIDQKVEIVPENNSELMRLFRDNWHLLDRRRAIFEEISDELSSAYEKHGKGQWGRHEFYGVIKEEFDEMWDDIKSNSPDEQLRKEIIQVAAMCVRFLELGDKYERTV